MTYQGLKEWPDYTVLTPSEAHALRIRLEMNEISLSLTQGYAIPLKYASRYCRFQRPSVLLLDMRDGKFPPPDLNKERGEKRWYHRTLDRYLKGEWPWDTAAAIVVSGTGHPKRGKRYDPYEAAKYLGMRFETFRHNFECSLIPAPDGTLNGTSYWYRDTLDSSGYTSYDEVRKRSHNSI